MDGEWTVAKRRRWKHLSRIGDHPRWKHEGITMMFVMNLPPKIRKESLKKLFMRFGDVVDVYMAIKRDANRKYFAFVRFKKVDDEYGLEKALQGIKYDGRAL